MDYKKKALKKFSCKSSYEEIVGAMKRKQIPLCERHHMDLHNGRLSREEMKIVQEYK